MKKILSAFLSFAIMLTAVLCVNPVAKAAEPGRTTIPVIYLEGIGSTILRETENGEKETLYPLQIPDGYIQEQVDIFLPVFAKAFFTQEWDEFCDVLCDILLPIFSKMKLDKNGEASDGSGIEWSWSRETLNDTKKDGTYGVTDYTFKYDWRLSPLVIAEQLHQYIEDVMYVTGADEVALSGRCFGSNVTAAYMQKYNGEHVKEVIHYASAVEGAAFLSKLFTGELFLEADGIERFLYDQSFGLGTEIEQLLRAFVTTFNDTYGLDIVCWAVNNVFKDIYLDIIPEVIINSYGTFPSFWSMVCPEDYEKAKETVFYGSDINEYANLIAKADAYYNNVQLTFTETTKNFMNNGIGFSNIVKYGKQDVPVTAKTDAMSDFLVTVEVASYGATTATVGKTLGDDYIAALNAANKGKYVSPDKQIDASTCISPDTTWFIKDLHHFHFPDSTNALISEIVNDDNFTVESSSAFPQYLLFDEANGQIYPLTTENMDTTPEWNTGYFEALKKFFEALFSIISNAIKTA